MKVVSVPAAAALLLALFNLETAAQASIVRDLGFERLVRDTAAKFADKMGATGEIPTTDDSTAPDPFPDHTVFKDQAEAIAWAKSQAAALQLALGADTFDVVDPAGNAQYPILQGYLHDTWAAYQKLFPTAVGQLPEPSVIIVKTSVVNALVMPDLATGKIGHAVWVFTGLIDGVNGVSDRAIYTGLFGHELAHSVFRHLLPKAQTFYSRYYQPGAQPGAAFGYQATNDDSLGLAVTKWEDDASLAGYADWAELQNLPSFGGALENLPILGFDNDSSAACQTATTALADWMTSPPFSIDIIHQNPIPTMSLAAISGASQSLIAELKACTSQPTVIANRSTLESFYEPGDSGSPSTEAIQAYDAAPDSTSALLAATGVERAEMKALEARIQFPTLRWFTYEEHADVTSAIVNFQMSLDKTSPGPLALNSAFTTVASLLGASPAELAACVADVAAKTAQPIGLPEDPHHSICYRYSNVSKLASAIQANQFSSFVADFVTKSTPPGGF